MSEEFCPECGAKITGKTGFCSECGAATTSLKKQINESNEIERIGNIQKWYHKPDKSHMMAIIYSIILPFFGNLYLRENLINLVLTLASILFIFINIIGLLTISDFYYRHGYLFIIFTIWWIISIVSLIYIIIQYNKRNVYFKKDDDKYSQESPLPNLFNKKYMKYIPFIILILFIIINMGVMFNDSPKTYDTPDFSLQYPHEYQSYGKWEYNNYAQAYQGSIQAKNYNDGITITSFSISGSLKNYIKEDLPYSGIDDYKKSGKTTIDNREAYILKDTDGEWTNVMFENNGNLYQIVLNGNSQQYMDSIVNSFKFK